MSSGDKDLVDIHAFPSLRYVLNCIVIQKNGFFMERE